MPDRRFAVADAPEPDYHLAETAETLHYAWDNAIEPALTVEPGAVVAFDCRDAFDRQLPPDGTVPDLDAVDAPGHPLTGPVAVEGAEPGDTLRVDLLAFEHEGWGVSIVPPGERGGGLLPEEFPDAHVRGWDLDGRTEEGERVARFADDDAPDVSIPIHPFPGNLGLAPGEDGEHDTMPPRKVGGNMDVKHLTAGSTLYLPVEAAGALFSIGDHHAAQGDGEVCITGIEAPMTVTARLDVVDHPVTQPEFETTGPFTPTGRDEPMYATTGIAPDLMDATKNAVRHMITHLHERRGFSRADAYVLCSAAVDLKISEVVDAPNWTVTAYLPESVLAG
ncbi:MAG: acetamidase/formamidase family protein [Halolamina sp.]